MSDYICFLITVLYESQGSLLRCALRFKRDDVHEDIWKYPMEKGSRNRLEDMLPSHVSSCGPIVDVEEIFDVCILEDQPELNWEDRSLLHHISKSSALLKGDK
jgi:hypothetical protein